MQETFVGRLRGACAVLPGSHVLVAVSGGADSTALLCFFCEIRETYPISVSCAHVEHGIRGAASEEDMRFVKALCEQKNVPFYGGRVDAPGYARAHGCGLEEAARALRYEDGGGRRRGRNRVGASSGGSGGDRAASRGAGERYPRALRDALAAGEAHSSAAGRGAGGAARVSAAHRSAVARGRNQRLRGLREKPDSPFGAACAGGGLSRRAGGACAAGRIGAAG